jgi:hypothetical protein
MSRTRPLTSRNPAAVPSLTRTVIVTSSDIAHLLPSVIACAAEFLDRTRRSSSVSSSIREVRV